MDDEKMFETKDSGKRSEFESGMVRDTDEDKPRFDLIMPEHLPYREQMLYRWAMLMMRGAKKYDERNWEKAESEEELKRGLASAFRHFLQWANSVLTGVDYDEEDHAAAVMFNISLVEYVMWKLHKRVG
jgi:hypothetical protein